MRENLPSNAAGCTFCLEGEITRGMIVYQFTGYGQCFDWMDWMDGLERNMTERNMTEKLVARRTGE